MPACDSHETTGRNSSVSLPVCGLFLVKQGHVVSASGCANATRQVFSLLLSFSHVVSSRLVSSLLVSSRLVVLGFVSTPVVRLACVANGAILLLAVDVLTSTVAADNNLATPRNRVSHLQYLPILLA